MLKNSYEYIDFNIYSLVCIRYALTKIRKPANSKNLIKAYFFFGTISKKCLLVKL